MGGPGRRESGDRIEGEKGSSLGEEEKRGLTRLGVVGQCELDSALALCEPGSPRAWQVSSTASWKRRSPGLLNDVSIRVAWRFSNLRAKGDNERRHLLAIRPWGPGVSN